MKSDNTYPTHVQADLNNGFDLTDPDNGHQRCQKLSDNKFLYRQDVGPYTHQITVDMNLMSDDEQQEAVDGYYADVEEVKETYGDSYLQIIAECYFENNIGEAMITDIE